VVCLGNPLAGDDAAGSLVAEELARMGWRDVEVCGSELSPVLSRLEEIETLVVVDAVDWGAPPGEFFVRKLDEVEDLSGRISHGISPLALLMVFREATGKPEEVYVVGIQPLRVELGEPPSEEVRRSAKRVASEILKILRG